MWWTVALAAPSVTITPTHGIRGTVIVDAPVDTVIPVMRDPIKVTTIDASGTKVTLQKKDGSCTIYDHISPSAFKSVEYEVRYCPTPQGTQGKMLSSNTFDSYAVQWIVTPHETGSKLEYHLDMETSMMVPQFVLDRTTKKAVLHLMEELEKHFKGAAAPQ